MSEEKLSPVEGFKTASNYLRGPIAEELVNGEPNFTGEAMQLLKHHGTYEQDDRDRRKEAKANKVPGGKYYSMMIRSVIPGGVLSSEQLLAQLDLCDEIGNTTIRLTTRQGIQLHGVLKENLRHYIKRVNEIQQTTLAACGDVCRNMMCSPLPIKANVVYDEMQKLCWDLKEHFKPRTGAYHELWISDEETGEKQLAGGGDGGPDPVEPIYGPTYLPRKFKMGVGLPEDNSADIYSQDIGFLGIVEGGKLVGYDLVVGGGFGRTPSAEKTFAAVAKALCYVPADQAIPAAEAVLKVQRDFGNRADRKRARLKYLVHDWGMEKFKTKVEEYYGGALEAPRAVAITEHNDGMGWGEQGDGKWYYGLAIENGRVKDEGDFRLKSALREIGTTLAPPLRITPHQNLIFCDIEPQDKSRLESVLRSHGVPLTEDVSLARRWSMACPAMPTCGLSITESERFMPGMIDQMDTMLAELGLQDELFTTRMTGCPNGCARPYNSDIGLVGRAVGKYTLFLGGSRLGHRLNWIYKDKVPSDEIVPELRKCFELFKAERQPSESFGDFCDRMGKDALLEKCG
ncbi:Sulfite reductase [ferredoxin] [Pseudobythopirellula maris]|uniref:Sulfite reductase [ferredoxin] n=2 Tax=Pseudobythopirellula maris TaxID=2527991 RepID=A0A5C5ZM91_9BACT|nr:Sulfite reductase [ferredoxin] [Pseudobythopirellula maris]